MTVREECEKVNYHVHNVIPSDMPTSPVPAPSQAAVLGNAVGIIPPSVPGPALTPLGMGII